jgi:hypothetical protein
MTKNPLHQRETLKVNVDDDYPDDIQGSRIGFSLERSRHKCLSGRYDSMLFFHEPGRSLARICFLTDHAETCRSRTASDAKMPRPRSPRHDHGCLAQITNPCKSNDSKKQIYQCTHVRERKPSRSKDDPQAPNCSAKSTATSGIQEKCTKKSSMATRTPRRT